MRSCWGGVAVVRRSGSLVGTPSSVTRASSGTPLTWISTGSGAAAGDDAAVGGGATGGLATGALATGDTAAVFGVSPAGPFERSDTAARPPSTTTPTAPATIMRRRERALASTPSQVSPVTAENVVLG